MYASNITAQDEKDYALQYKRRGQNGKMDPDKYIPARFKCVWKFEFLRVQIPATIPDKAIQLPPQSIYVWSDPSVTEVISSRPDLIFKSFLGHLKDEARYEAALNRFNAPAPFLYLLWALLRARMTIPAGTIQLSHHTVRRVLHFLISKTWAKYYQFWDQNVLQPFYATQ